MPIDAPRWCSGCFPIQLGEPCGGRKPPHPLDKRLVPSEVAMRGASKILLAIGMLWGFFGAADAVTLKAVMHSDVKIVDPIWTTAYISRNHGYMIYDTLFAMDEKGEIKPQMIDTYEQSAD